MHSDLDIIIVRKEEINQSHHDFHVRRSVVLHAFQWLHLLLQYSHSLCYTSLVLELLKKYGYIALLK